MGAKHDTIYQFDRFQLDPHRRLLMEGDKHLPLPPKALELLLFLIGNRDRIVSKEHLMQALWPKTIVEESNLTQNVFVLRKALGEDARAHRFIVTVPGSGYRFVAQVRPASEAAAGTGREDKARTAQFDADHACRSIAVLPFRSLTADPMDEYLGHGMAEALTARLAGIPRLTVRPTAGIASRDNGPGQDPPRLGRRLGVASIIYGTVQRQGERVRIMVQNVRVRDGALEWAEQFEGTLTEIFELQDRITEKVVNAITFEVTTEVRVRTWRRHTENTDAYLIYLKGRHSLGKRSPEGIRRAAEFFEQVNHLDPGYALAFAGSADCHCLLACYSIVPPREAWAKAKSAAIRALEIDGRLAEAHAVLGLVRMAYEWDWAGAEREFSQALDLNPDCAMAHDYYAEYLTAIGQHARAIAAIKQAQELEPLALIIHCDVGWNLLRARRYPEAIKQLENTLAMDPNFALARWSLGSAYEAQGLYPEALAQFEQSFRLFDDGPSMLASQGHAYAAHGDIRRAQQVIDQLIEISMQRYVSSFDVALVYAGLDNKAQAFLWLEKACEERPWHLTFLKIDPRLDPLRSDPRFKTVLHQLGWAG